MTEVPKEKKLKKLPPPVESTPLKFWYGEQEDEMDFVLQLKEGQSKFDAVSEQLKEIVGVKDTELASSIIDTGASTIEPMVKNDQLNIVAQTLHDFGPRNAIGGSPRRSSERLIYPWHG